MAANPRRAARADDAGMFLLAAADRMGSTEFARPGTLRQPQHPASETREGGIAPRKAASTEWPRLDLAKHQIQSLAATRSTELEDFADADHGLDLYEDLIQEGMYQRPGSL